MEQNKATKTQYNKGTGKEIIVFKYTSTKGKTVT